MLRLETLALPGSRAVYGCIPTCKLYPGLRKLGLSEELGRPDRRGGYRRTGRTENPTGPLVVLIIDSLPCGW